jgi:hypothetical protein
MWGQLLFEMYLFTKDLSDLITAIPINLVVHRFRAIPGPCAVFRTFPGGAGFEPMI